MDNYIPLLAHQLMKHMGKDFIPKGKLKRLLDAINVSYERYQSMEGPNQDLSVLFEEDILEDKIINYPDGQDLLFSFTPTGHILSVNDAFCQYFGKSREELVGRYFFSSIPADEVEKIKQVHQQLSPHNNSLILDYPILMADGSIRWLQWSKKATFDEVGKINTIEAFGRDITPYKKANIRLKASEAHYRSLFEATFEGILVLDKGTILDVNPAALAMLGYELSELLGVNALQYIEKENRNQAVHHLRQESTATIEVQLLRKDGLLLMVELLGKKYFHKGRWVKVVAFRDITTRKKYEKEIQWQKTFLHTILDGLPINVFLKDRAGRFVFLNRHTCQTVGIEPDVALGKTDFDLFSMDVAQKLYADDQQVWENQRPFIKEEKIVRNESVVHLFSGKNIVHLPNFHEPLLLGYSIDITDRVKVEEELRDKEVFIRQILDTDPNLIFVKDYNGYFLLVNQAVADLFGTSKENILLQNNVDIHPIEAETDRFSEIDQQVIDQQRTIVVEETFTRHDGEVRWFQTIKKPLLMSNNQIRVLGISLDITEQKRMLERLQDSEANYRQIIEYASDMIYRTDAYGYFTYVNPVCNRAFGYIQEELLGLHFSQIVAEPYRQQAIDFYKNHFKTKTVDTYFEFIATTKDGETLWIGQNVHMLLEGDWIAGCQAVARNITQIKQVEQELLGAIEVAEESMKAKERFLSMMTHEIRTPLNAVIGLTQLLNGEKNEEMQKEYLNAIQFSADNLMAIINDILDFSKIESGKITFEQVQFDTDSIFQGMRQSFGFDAAEKNIKLLFNTDNKLPCQLIGDPARLNQILINLVGNALKFTEKGYVEVGAEVISEDENTLTIQFSVIDTGIGIPADKLNYIFESFSQVSTETARKYGGTGLGLSITRQLVELQGGSISVQSRLGLGSTFSFTLSFGKTHQSSFVQESKRNKELMPKHELAGIRVLLVEDNRMNQLVAGEFLKKWGLRVDMADDGFIALEMLKHQQYELILMDLQMPGMDGFETTRRIRAIGETYFREVPIVALTASVLPDIKFNVLNAGMNDLVTKPFNPSDLYAKLQKYLGLSSLNGQTPSANGNNQDKVFKYINLEYLESISINNTQFVEQMMRLFLKQTPEFIARAKQACEQQDWKEVGAVVHKLKATTATVGIAQLEPMLKTIEVSVTQQKDLDQIEGIMNQIADICDVACTELNEKLAILASN